jgi:hypothetical protein
MVVKSKISGHFADQIVAVCQNLNSTNSYDILKYAATTFITLQFAVVADSCGILIQTDRFSVCKMSGTLCQNDNRKMNVWDKVDFFNVLQKPDQSDATVQ